MRTKRHMISVSVEAFAALQKIRDRIHETEGKYLSLAQTIEVSIVGLLSPSIDVDQMRRTLVAVTAELVAQLKPELYPHFKGVAFNERTGEAIVDFGGQGEDTRYSAIDPVSAVRN